MQNKTAFKIGEKGVKATDEKIKVKWCMRCL